MTMVADDRARLAARSAPALGLALALVSAVSFGLSGALARRLFEAGWTPGAVVLVRVALGALVLLPLGLHALRRRWHLLRGNARTIVGCGLLGVAGAQFGYFSAVQHMQVGPALLLEYTAPAAVVLWLWLRHGQRPGPLTAVGALAAAAGLVLVLDLLSGADLNPAGVAWALAAMVGAASYFLLAADEGGGLPPLALAAGGLVVAALALGLLALLGLLPVSASTQPVTYGGRTVGWWVPLLLLGTVTAGLAYATGVAAIRRLGSRLASFVALTEVVAGVAFAWLLLGELPAAVQLLGGLLVLAGVVLVKLGEAQVSPPRPHPTSRD